MKVNPCGIKNVRSSKNSAAILTFVGLRRFKKSELNFHLFNLSFMSRYFLFSAVAIHFPSITELK